VRKRALAPLLLLAFGLAACGGGGGSGNGATTAGKPHAPRPETAWGKEVEAVMRRFENQAARVIAQIHTSSSQARLEPMYREYGAALVGLGEALEATKAPAECAALRKRMGEDAAALAQLSKKLGHEGDFNAEEFAALAAVQETKMRRYGHDLTEITYRPRC
jgi:hypothetical protein